MNPIRLSEIARVLDAEILGDENPIVESVCTDSREMQPKSLFFAIRGDNFDGREFLNQAATGGAVAAVVDRRQKNSPGIPLLRVGNSREALGRLAAFVRSKFAGNVIAVAGSNGKTGTKRLIDAALTGPRRGTISPKSFNNDIGVPLAIFPAHLRDDYLVLEIGTNRPGEVRKLAHISRPDIAVITNCTQEHLEGLGDEAGVRKENASIIEGLQPSGTLVVHGDDAELLKSVAGWSGPRTTFGLHPSNDLFATNIQCRENGTRFFLSGGSTSVAIPILGKHSAVNALAAIAVGRVMGLSDGEIISGLSRATGAEMRLELQKYGGIAVLNDAYNANPASMRSALQTLFDLPASGRRIAVLGDMRELGSASESYHRQLGDCIAKEFPMDLLICVGTESRAILKQATRAGFAAQKARHFASVTLASPVVQEFRNGDLVLLKASRAIGLEALAGAIHGQHDVVKVA